MLENYPTSRNAENSVKNRRQRDFPFQKAYNNISGQTRNLVDRQLPFAKDINRRRRHPGMKIVHKQNPREKPYFSTFAINASHIATEGPPPKDTYNFLEKSLRKGANWIIRGINRGIKVIKENLFNPIFGEQSNVINILRGKTVQRDFKKAQRDGELISSRLIGGNFQVSNPPREWISNIIKYATPEWFQRALHKTVVRNHDLWTAPFRMIIRGAKKAYNGIRRPFYSDKKWKKIRFKEKQASIKRTERGDKIMEKANRVRTFHPQIDELDTDPKQGKVINFTKRARERRLSKEDDFDSSESLEEEEEEYKLAS